MYLQILFIIAWELYPFSVSWKGTNREINVSTVFGDGKGGIPGQLEIEESSSSFCGNRNATLVWNNYSICNLILWSVFACWPSVYKFIPRP